MNKIFLCLSFFGAMICAPSLVSQNHLQVYIFVSEECPACIYMTSDLNLLSEKYQESADFHLVFVKKNSTQKSVDSFVKKYKLKHFDIILDNSQELCKKLGGTVTPEAVVLDETGICNSVCNKRFAATATRILNRQSKSLCLITTSRRQSP